MDEKQSPLNPPVLQMQPRLVRRRLMVPAFFALLILYCVFGLARLPFGQWWLDFISAHRDHATEFATPKDTGSPAFKIGLEAHVMSKCPDAAGCLKQLVVPAMEEIQDAVDFRLSFIGDVDPIDNTTVICKHGPTECLGNMFALCAQDLYPNSSKISLGFSNCLISSWRDVPARSLIEQCALEHAIDFDKLNNCVSDNGYAEELLRASVLRSKEAGVVYSCTVRLGGEPWCIFDGGRWKDCQIDSSVEALVGEIKHRASHST